MLVPQTQSLHIGQQDGPSAGVEGLSSDSNQHGFLNISVTPLECSIVCHSSWAKSVFEPVIAALPAKQAATVSVFRDTYMVLAVMSAGLDAASRVLELSSPLALAGIPIFFITTYYSDFMLVPSREHQRVVTALQDRGFQLTEDHDAVMSSSAVSSYSRYNNGGSPPTSPGTPPPSNDNELQTRTFELLNKRSVSPYIADGLELVQCSGREVSQLSDTYGHRASISRQQSGPDRRQSWIENVDTKLYTSIISALVSRPRFMSVTLAQDDPPSLLLDRTLLDMFSDSLVGDTDNILVPIFLDLVNLPDEVTGIVCGVSGRLVDDMKETSELSYLSTARAGAVVLPEAQSARALHILRPLLQESAE